METEEAFPVTPDKATFSVDLSLPGVQALLRVVLAIEVELRQR